MRWRDGLALAAGLSVLAGLAACGGSPSSSSDAGQAAAQPDSQNALIGNWTFAGVGSDPSPNAGCATQLAFTATDETVTFTSGPNTNAVTYNASPTSVTVIGNTGLANAVTYKILDPTHIALDAPTACTFVRAG